MSDNLSTLDSLHHEILTNVFVRLPIKSIVTCTAVCKTWRSFIQNPTFISNHLHHSSNNKHPLLLFRLCPLEPDEANEKEQYVLHFDNQDFNEYTRFVDFHLHDPGYDGIYHVVGTCNGLIFLADAFDGYKNRFFFWNPCVRKFVELPIPVITCPWYSVGFGFDSKANDYKVVKFVTLEEEGQKGTYPPEVEVYSLSTGNWRMVTALPPIGTINRERAAFVNGALHWVALRKTGDKINKFLNFVIVFDLGEEVFREIALPKLSDKNGWVSVSISAYGNSLALFQRESNGLSIWVMEHYADASSWTKIVSFADFVLIEDKPKGFRKSGEVILERGGGYLVSQDLKTKEVKNLGIRGNASADNFVDSYVESLVLLDKHNQGKRNNNRKCSNLGGRNSSGFLKDGIHTFP